MQRTPSIHISSKVLEQILAELLGKHSKAEINSLVKLILVKSRAHSLAQRSLNVSNEKLLEKSNKVVASSRSDADNFANILTLCRRKNHHRGISQIKPGSRDWLQIKDITALALNFCNEFGLNKKDGFRIYIETALKLSNKFMITRLSMLYDRICEYYSAIKIIESDIHPSKTELAYSTYNELVLQKVGSCINYKEIPEKFVFFVKAKDQAIKRNVSPDIYIKAQFAALEWANALPDPIALVGSKSEERLQKYLYENGVNTSKDVKQVDAYLKFKERHGRSVNQ